MNLSCNIPTKLLNNILLLIWILRDFYQLNTLVFLNIFSTSFFTFVTKNSNCLDRTLLFNSLSNLTQKYGYFQRAPVFFSFIYLQCLCHPTRTPGGWHITWTFTLMWFHVVGQRYLTTWIHTYVWIGKQYYRLSNFHYTRTRGLTSFKIRFVLLILVISILVV